MRDLYGDIFLDKSKTLRVRLGQSKVPVRLGEPPVEPEPRPARAARRAQQRRRGRTRPRRVADVGVAHGPAALPRPGRRRALKGSGDYGVAAVGALLRPGPEPIRPERRRPRVRARVLPVQDRRRTVLRARRPGLPRPLRLAHPGHHQRRRDLHARPRRADGTLDERVAVTAVALSAAVRPRSRVDLRQGPAAARRPALHRGAHAARRLRAGRLPRPATPSAPGIRSPAGTTSTAPASSPATRRATR